VQSAVAYFEPHPLAAPALSAASSTCFLVNPIRWPPLILGRFVFIVVAVIVVVAVVVVVVVVASSDSTRVIGCTVLRLEATRLLLLEDAVPLDASIAAASVAALFDASTAASTMARTSTCLERVSTNFLADSSSRAVPSSLDDDMIETSGTNPKATWLLLLLLLLLLFARLAFAFSKFAVQRHQLGRLALRRWFDVGQGGWNVSQVANEGPDQTHADGGLADLRAVAGDKDPDVFVMEC